MSQNKTEAMRILITFFISIGKYDSALRTLNALKAMGNNDEDWLKCTEATLYFLTDDYKQALLVASSQVIEDKTSNFYKSLELIKANCLYMLGKKDESKAVLSQFIESKDMNK